jgi:RNA polymerase sigma-70 factor (ECF subfamily)
VLDPDVVLRSDFGARRLASMVVHGAAAVAGQALMYRNPAAHLHPALVNGAAGVVVTVGERPIAVMGFTAAEGKVVEIDAIADPERVRRIAAPVLAAEWFVQPVKIVEVLGVVVSQVTGLDSPPLTPSACPGQ